MKSRFTLIPLLITLASIGAVITTGQHVPSLRDAEPTHASGVQALVHGHPDALAEMTVHAIRRLGDVTIRPETFGDDPHWTPEYRLQWVRAETAAGRGFIVYLATDKQHPEFSFVAIAEVDGAAPIWERNHWPASL